jgi:hypothetical protein
MDRKMGTHFLALSFYRFDSSRFFFGGGEVVKNMFIGGGEVVKNMFIMKECKM